MTKHFQQLDKKVSSVEVINIDIIVIMIRRHSTEHLTVYNGEIRAYSR